jgi:hypothetical protein
MKPRPLIPRQPLPVTPTFLRPLIPRPLPVPPPVPVRTPVPVPPPALIAGPAPTRPDYSKFKLARGRVPAPSLFDTLRGFGQPPIYPASSGIFDTPYCPPRSKVPFATTGYNFPHTVPAPCAPAVRQRMACPPSQVASVVVAPPRGCPPHIAGMAAQACPPRLGPPIVVAPPQPCPGMNGFGSPDGLMGIF